MLLIPCGICEKANESSLDLSGWEIDELANLTWSNMIMNNVITVTLGKLVGGMMCVATTY